ncbi:hypothetical protein M3Y95_00260500 [Aphelenchoides besseyi]|nr:hypothetical protein M3Y95_00260500 [Aphelenchoides besseyi]
MKRKLFTKLFSVLTLKDITGSAKTYPRDYRARHASAKRKRARSSQSSTLSNYEPMLPTIIEEAEPECDFSSCQSTIHYDDYGTLTALRTHSLVNAC